MSLVLTGLTQLQEPECAASRRVVAVDAAGDRLAWLEPPRRDRCHDRHVFSAAGRADGRNPACSTPWRARSGWRHRSSVSIHPRFRTPVAVHDARRDHRGPRWPRFCPSRCSGSWCLIGALLAFIAVAAAGVLVLTAHVDRVCRASFRTPFVPWVPIGAIIVCGCMMIGLPLATWLRFAVWLGLGLCIYALYGRDRTGKLRRIRSECTTQRLH